MRNRTYFFVFFVVRQGNDNRYKFSFFLRPKYKINYDEANRKKSNVLFLITWALCHAPSLKNQAKFFFFFINQS